MIAIEKALASLEPTGFSQRLGKAISGRRRLSSVALAGSRLFDRMLGVQAALACNTVRTYQGYLCEPSGQCSYHCVDQCTGDQWQECNPSCVNVYCTGAC